MKLCFSTLGCPDWTLTQAIEKGAAYGFDGIELRIHGDRHIDPSLSTEERKQIRQLLEAHNLTVPIISGYTQFCTDDMTILEANARGLLENAALAADLKTPYLRTFMGDEAFTPKGAKILRDACDKAYTMGVTVLLETHDAFKTGKKLAEVINTVDSTGLGILWDIQHPLSEGELPEDTWKYIGEHTRHVHVRDADQNHCLMGNGTLPVPHIVKLLLNKGYDGFFSFEWAKTWMPDLEAPK